MNLLFAVRALVCSVMLVVGSALAPLQPGVMADEATSAAPPEEAPFTLYIQPSAAATPTPSVPAAPSATPAIPTAVPSQTPMAPPSSATPVASPSAGNRRGNAIITPWKQTGTARTATRVQAPAMVQPSSFPQLTYGDGAVERTGSLNYSIFWKPAGASMSANYRTLINQYFQDIGGSQFYGVMTQYSDPGGSIANDAAVGGTWTDLTAYPSNTPAYPANTLTDNDIQQSVVRAMNVNGWWPAAGTNAANFFVYTASGEASCIDQNTCSNNYFCAYHSAFQIAHSGSTIEVKYANHPYDGDNLGGCATKRSPNNDPATDSEINSTSHEHFEMVTDPDPNSGWVDSGGQEIGDKCRNSYGSELRATDVSLGAHDYSLQQEWSNLGAGCAWSLPQASFDLTTNPGVGSGSGSITYSASGLHCTAACFVNFASGTVVTLSAAAASGSAFAGWSGACSGTGACSVTMNTAQSVTATFNPNTTCSPRPPVSVSVTPSGAGFQAILTSSGANNALVSVHFGSATNAGIDIGSQSTRSGNFAFALAPSTVQTTFYVHRTTPGAATTVPLVVTDGCGDWSTFVGVGAGVP